MKTKISCPISGFSRNRIFILTGIIFLVAALGLFNYIKLRTREQSRVECFDKLHQMIIAKEKWIAKNGKVPISTDIFVYTPKCPSGGRLTLGGIGERPFCSVHGCGP